NAAASAPAEQAEMRWMDSSMSWTLTRQLRGKHDLGLGEDRVAEQGLDRVAGHEVDGSSEPRCKPVSERDELEEPDGPLELDEEVDVARRPRFVPRDGT